jgi:hypothetical protein
MGFYFRKSVKFGPIRFNFSKSGIGVSAGIKGARISSGPRGTYVHAGRNGFYYSQRIGQPHLNEPPLQPEPRVGPPPPVAPNNFVIETADVSHLTETSITELLNQINEIAAQMRFAPWAILATIGGAIVVWFLVLAFTAPLADLLLSDRDSAVGLATFAAFVGAIGIATLGSILSWRIHKGDEVKRTTPLFYELEQEEATKFTVVQHACQALSHSARIWRVHTNQPTWDWKRNAGASALITRQPILVGLQQPPHIATNVEVWSIRLTDMTLFFLPDYIFVRQRSRYGAVSYDSLTVSFSPTRFIEDQAVPVDAQVVDHTWQFVNKKGGPDRRFSNNRQLPIAQYGFIQLQSNTGLNIHLNVSNLEAASRFADAFHRIRSKSGGSGEYRRGTAESRQQANSPFIDPKIRSAYEMLGVPVTASAEQIVSAYRNMAKMYHPDRLANLAPEFIELAEERMKEINVAYERLKRK